MLKPEISTAVPVAPIGDLNREEPQTEKTWCARTHHLAILLLRQSLWETYFWKCNWASIISICQTLRKGMLRLYPSYACSPDVSSWEVICTQVQESDWSSEVKAPSMLAVLELSSRRGQAPEEESLTRPNLQRKPNKLIEKEVFIALLGTFKPIEIDWHKWQPSLEQPRVSIFPKFAFRDKHRSAGGTDRARQQPIIMEILTTAWIDDWEDNYETEDIQDLYILEGSASNL